MARVSALAAPSGPSSTGFASSSIPVAIDVPDEAIDRAGRIVEAIGADRLGHFARGVCGLMRDPAVQRLLRRRRLEALSGTAQWFISAKREAFQSLVAKLR